MPYCVHCGVELEGSEKQCPLCQTKVLDPNGRELSGTALGFPIRMEEPKRKINTRFFVLLAGVVLLFPLIIVVLIDLAFSNNLTWSLYVLGAEICLWAFVILPISCPHKPVYLYLGVDLITTAGYVLLIYLASNGTGWYFPLALPLILSVGGATLLVVLICRRKEINNVEKSGWVLIVLSALMAIIDFAVCYYMTGTFSVSWSLYAAIPLSVFSIILLVISKNARICHWIEKKLFL